MWANIATLWGVLGGLGVAIDLIVLRSRQKRGVYFRLIQLWRRIRRTRPPRLARLVAVSTLRRVRPILYKKLVRTSRGSVWKWKISWGTLLVVSITSCCLSVAALIIGLMYGSAHELSVQDLLPFLIRRFDEIVLYVFANLPFDVLTIWVTLWALGLVCRAGVLASTAIVFADLSVGIILGLCANALKDLLVFGTPGGFFFEIWVSCEQVYYGFLWLLSGATDAELQQHLISLLFAATTLIPTMMFLVVVLLAVFSKPIAHAGQQLAIFVLGAAREYRHEPETLPVATMFAALVGVISTTGLIIRELLVRLVP